MASVVVVLAPKATVAPMMGRPPGDVVTVPCNVPLPIVVHGENWNEPNLVNQR